MRDPWYLTNFVRVVGAGGVFTLMQPSEQTFVSKLFTHTHVIHEKYPPNPPNPPKCVLYM